MSLISWVPMYIKQKIQDMPRRKITAEYWNSMWNLVITQGDNNAEGIAKCKTAFEQYDKDIPTPLTDSEIEEICN